MDHKKGKSKLPYDDGEATPDKKTHARTLFRSSNLGVEDRLRILDQAICSLKDDFVESQESDERRLRRVITQASNESIHKLKELSSGEIRRHLKVMSEMNANLGKLQLDIDQSKRDTQKAKCVMDEAVRTLSD